MGIAVTFLKTRIGSKKTNSSFFNSNALNSRLAKLSEAIKRYEKDYNEVERHAALLRQIAEFLPQYFLEFEGLKKVSFETSDPKERERNNKLLRSFLKVHETIEFEIRGNKDKNDNFYEAVMAILRDKKTTFDNLIDLFYKK